MGFSLTKAEKEQFAIFQTMYSNADYNMWYDWERRLQDTKWTDECYFVLLDGKKIGGYIVTTDTICFPFLILPYDSREEFWDFVVKFNLKSQIKGANEQDAEVLQKLGYRIISRNRVMCRPTELMRVELRSKFNEMSISEYDVTGADTLLGHLIVDGYQGSICNDIFGEATVESAITDMRAVLAIYRGTDYSKVITDSSGKPVALCLAGSGEDYIHHYAEIADICVLPRYRGKGLARFLISDVISNAYGKSPYVKLLVQEGNSAEILYKMMGFISGPCFVNMEREGLCNA